MRRLARMAIVTTVVCGTWACTGSGSGSGPSGTTATAPNAAGAVTVNIVGINGDQSFSPNPATLPMGQTIIWHNADAITHRVVVNDGSADTGNLAPGASSQPMTLRVGGSQYHCSIHPAMIGSINQTTSPAGSAPPPSSY
jgi:plastocyanin